VRNGGPMAGLQAHDAHVQFPVTHCRSLFLRQALPALICRPCICRRRKYLPTKALRLKGVRPRLILPHQNAGDAMASVARAQRVLPCRDARGRRDSPAETLSWRCDDPACDTRVPTPFGTRLGLASTHVDGKETVA
jgi:hypothetical protein